MKHTPKCWNKISFSYGFKYFISKHLFGTALFLSVCGIWRLVVAVSFLKQIEKFARVFQIFKKYKVKYRIMYFYYGLKFCLCIEKTVLEVNVIIIVTLIYINFNTNIGPWKSVLVIMIFTRGWVIMLSKPIDRSFCIRTHVSLLNLHFQIFPLFSSKVS